jgi:hypothetical protein
MFGWSCRKNEVPDRVQIESFPPTASTGAQMSSAFGSLTELIAFISQFLTFGSEVGSSGE